MAGVARNWVESTSPKMASDLTTAVALAGAAITGALANVEIKWLTLKDEAFAAEVRKRAESPERLTAT